MERRESGSALPEGRAAPSLGAAGPPAAEEGGGLAGAPAPEAPSTPSSRQDQSDRLRRLSSLRGRRSRAGTASDIAASVTSASVCQSDAARGREQRLQSKLKSTAARLSDAEERVRELEGEVSTLSATLGRKDMEASQLSGARDAAEEERRREQELAVLERRRSAQLRADSAAALQRARDLGLELDAARDAAAAARAEAAAASGEAAAARAQAIAARSDVAAARAEAAEARGCESRLRGELDSAREAQRGAELAAAAAGVALLEAQGRAAAEAEAAADCAAALAALARGAWLGSAQAAADGQQQAEAWRGAAARLEAELEAARGQLEALPALREKLAATQCRAAEAQRARADAAAALEQAEAEAAALRGHIAAAPAPLQPLAGPGEGGAEAAELRHKLDAARSDIAALREQVAALRRDRNETAGELRAERALRSELVRRLTSADPPPPQPHGNGPSTPGQRPARSSGGAPAERHHARGSGGAPAAARSASAERQLAALQRKHDRSRKREQEARLEAQRLREELRSQVQCSAWAPRCADPAPTPLPPPPVPWGAPPPAGAPSQVPTSDGARESTALLGQQHDALVRENQELLRAQPLRQPLTPSQRSPGGMGAEAMRLRDLLAQREADVERLARSLDQQHSSAAESLRQRDGEIAALRCRVRDLAQAARCSTGIATPNTAPFTIAGAPTPPPRRLTPPREHHGTRPQSAAILGASW